MANTAVLAATAGLSTPRIAGGPARHASRLWYRQPAREWIEALPIGNGRMGAMIFGGIGHERLQLNEDTLWTGGPYDPVSPEAREALPEVRRLVEQGQYAEAEALADAKLIGRPRTQMAYQSFGELRLIFPGPDGEAQAYERELDLDSAIATVRYTRNGIEYRREILASTADDILAIRLSARPRSAWMWNWPASRPKPMSRQMGRSSI
ncbi:hypothetical protein FHS61_001068 [Altererythrobacter atlanticus]|uniref:glycoside hydrolase family 95 protein n=1 Tax=Croceibacterium atlanticum TaxID=1267766 RepID=UPI001798466A|nr:glycoside hydrolase family 95 protein [Croceibacterium atlanticum]MBB5732064.1 hypothetical protein [Croceibacterium atlanticum]